MLNTTNPNQTSETAQLSNAKNNLENLNKDGITPNIMDGKAIYNQLPNVKDENQMPYGINYNQATKNDTQNHTQNITIVNNQPLPGSIIIEQKETIIPVDFRTESVTMKCPNCKNNIQTQIEKSLNCGACALNGFCCCVYPIVQCCNNKECGCMNCKHTCPKCGRIIGHYHAM